MPVVMTLQKLPKKEKQIKAMLSKEFNFIKQIFSVVSLPKQIRDENEENADFEMVTETHTRYEEKELPNRARSIAELEEKLEKIKSQKNFNLKNKLAKKSLNSKLNKKIKKSERQKKSKAKPDDETSVKQEASAKLQSNAKPVFNTDGKLVFSKFDFSSVSQKERKYQKGEKDPKKILESLKEQEKKFKEMEETQHDKVKEIKEKMAWKNVLQKAEGQKVKDDPILLKKSIKKMEQKKKQSKKQWDNRVKGVEEKKEARQKKRKENIAKKKKEKKSKVVKSAVKRGRVVI